MLNSLANYLEESARRFPDKLALSDEKLELTFRQMREAAQKVASYICREYGAKNRPVAVEVDRASQSVVLFLGVLYSGNFYVPIDKRMPKERMAQILDDVDPLLSLGIKEKNIFNDFAYAAKSYDALMEEAMDESAVERAVKGTIDMDPAYMIYTSGSTGRPKGVVISHRMVMDFADFLSCTFSITGEDIIANQAPFYFDCSVKGIYQMLRNGATLYILRPSYFMFPIKAVEFFNEKKVTTLLWATSGLNIISGSGALSKIRPASLKRVFFSGETLYGKNYLPWKEACPPDTRFINLYGPTEVTVDCCYYEINREFSAEEVIPIGGACPNMEVFLLDEKDEPIVGDGLGEICARGTGIAYGYYKDPEKTEAVFVQNPSHGNYRDIIYRTGDLARTNEYGELVFVSRKDQQIKHQGNRIELGELEAAANKIEGVRESVAFYDYEAKSIILAYSGEEDAALSHKLREQVPKYMLPAEILFYEEFPYNRNGKIDRKRIKADYDEKN